MLATNLTSATITGLEPQKRYYMRVRARNGNSIPTAFDITFSTRTLSTRDRTAPAPVGGLWATFAPAACNTIDISMEWDPVSKNVSGNATSAASSIDAFRTPCPLIRF